MVASRTIVVAGGGIGGLTAALALAERGFRAVVIDQSEPGGDGGAGIQLTPNATRVLLALGLADRLKPLATSPLAIRVMPSIGRDEIVRIPLGPPAESRYGAPYWIMHRGDLRAALLAAAREHPDITIETGARVEAFASHANGVTVKAMRGQAPVGAEGLALVGADGVWSRVRTELGHREEPRFARRVAWRTLVPADMAPPAFRAPIIHLWLGPKSHLVHYPVKAASMINVVAIAADSWRDSGWTTRSDPQEVMSHFPAAKWSRHARDLLGVSQHWTKWALADLAPLRHWGDGPVTLLGDAAHPLLPFLAQGAAMAIEDAAILAAQIAATPADLAGAMRRYEGARRARTARMRRAARSNGTIYQYSGPDASARNRVMRFLGGKRLLDRYDWIYDWQAA